MNNYAREEFRLLESKDYEDEDQRPIVLEYKDEILALVDKFNQSGQSGGSAPYTAAIIAGAVKDLCMQQPLGGIHDTPEEWGEQLGYGGPPCFQHKRLSAVFKKEEHGRPYYLDAIYFQGEDEWDTFSGEVDGISSSQFIKAFPFFPKTFYIKVVREQNDTDPNRCSCGDGDYLYHLKDPKQLEEVFEYYDKRPLKRS